MFGNCLALCLQNVCFILVKKLVTFCYVVGAFSYGNLRLFWKFLNWSANESKTLFVVRPVTIGKGVGGTALETEGRRAEWTTWESVCVCVWVCVCVCVWVVFSVPKLRCVLVKKKISTNKSAISTKKKNDLVSINQLNHKVPEKSRATEELIRQHNVQKCAYWRISKAATKSTSPI